MTAEKIICSMNDVRDNYITEYAEKTMKEYGKNLRHFPTWSICAACLALFIIGTPALIHFFNTSEAVDPKSGARYEFGSYAELCNILPERNIIANIPNSKEANINAYVECPEGTIDFADYNNYSYLDIDISYDDGTGISIFCVVKSEKTAKEEIDSNPLTYPPERVSMTTVSDCNIYCTSYEDNADKVNLAVFSIDSSLYKVRTTTFSRKELIQYVSDMLNR